MKYLVITARRQQIPLPPEAMAGVLSAQREWIQDRVADGTIDTIYGFPQGGGVAIVNAESGEELTSQLMASPAYMTLDWDVRPLTDIDLVLANLTEMFERVTARTPA